MLKEGIAKPLEPAFWRCLPQASLQAICQSADSHQLLADRKVGFFMSIGRLLYGRDAAHFHAVARLVDAAKA